MSPKPPLPPSAHHRPDPLQILIVDDEPSVREVLSTCLAVEGHNVGTANDGVDGLARFCSGRWDVVLTDRAMPRMSGDQLAKAIRQVNAEVAIVLVTGFAESAADLGVIDSVVKKPFTIASLRDGIGQALNRRSHSHVPERTVSAE